MQNAPKSNEFELLCIIVNFGLGSDIVNFCKQHEIIGGTIFFGKGTIKNAFLEFLYIAQTRKEIILMSAEATTAHTVLAEVSRKFNFQKPHHGIAFSTSIRSILGTKSHTCKIDRENREVKNPMYNVIMAVVDNGK